MKILDILADDTIKPIRDDINKFTNDLLHGYLCKTEKRISNNQNCFTRKHIHDAVWGTIELNAGEVLIIDSPLIQRLRRITHLGLASLLFPGADYSRFEHTLGVLNVAGKISSKIQSDPAISSKYEKDYIDPTQIVRLAAIFHDSGHFFCSHASERFFNSPHFSGYNEVKNILRLFKTKIGKSNPILSEIVSVLIVTSPAAINLIHIAWPFFEKKALHSQDEAKLSSGYIASLILGVPVDKKMLPFSRIISGPIDADKCDYLARDSTRTGVPVAVDLSRVIQKLKLIKGKPENLGLVWDDSQIPEDVETYLLGVSYSAMKAVEEIMLSRSLMHEKIYYHHKILSSEEMLRQALKLLDNAGFENLSKFQYALKLTDSDIISSIPDHYIKAVAKASGLNDNFDENSFLQACRLLHNLKERNLLKRACAFNIHFMSETSTITKSTKNFIIDIFSAIDKEKQEGFIKLVTNETKNILKVLGKAEDISDEIDYMILPVYVPQALNEGFDFPVEIGGKIRKAQYFFQAESWDDSRKVANNTHFLIGEPDILKEIFIATEKVLLTEFGILLENESFELVKMMESQIDSLKSQLTEKGYYFDATQIIPNSVFNYAQHQELKKLLNIFQTYEGPKGYRITKISQIISFLKQFAFLIQDPTELFFGLIELLGSIIILNRGSIGNNLREVFDKAAKKYNCSPWEFTLSTLGGLRDSSNNMTYYLNDLQGYFGEELKIDIISNVVKKDLDSNRPIVFIDDAFYSGTQVVSIFEEMCGIPIEKRTIKEEHNVKLSSEDIERLKNIPLAICYCYSNSKNMEFVNEKIKSLDLNFNIFAANDFPPPIFDKEDLQPFSSEERKEHVHKAFQKIGEELLRSNKINPDGNLKDGWTETRIKECALGYNNAQQCIILPWNTPTYTLTPFWLEGTLKNGTKWIPLFPRQSK